MSAMTFREIARMNHNRLWFNDAEFRSCVVMFDSIWPTLGQSMLDEFGSAHAEGVMFTLDSTRFKVRFLDGYAQAAERHRRRLDEQVKVLETASPVYEVVDGKLVIDGKRLAFDPSSDAPFGIVVVDES